jgi:hypothetical protein
VSDLDVIVDLCVSADDRGSYCSAIDCGSGSDLYVVIDRDDAHLWHFD